MINNHFKPINAEEADFEINQRAFKTARRRSLSGSVLPSKTLRKSELIRAEKIKDYERSGNLPEIKDKERSIDSLSSSGGINAPELCGRSVSSCHHSTFFNSHGENSHAVSVKMKIKHFLAEHIGKTHPCHHPEYHVHKKASESNISTLGSSNNESNSQEYTFKESSGTSFSKETLYPKAKSVSEIRLLGNSLNMATNILDRIRNINIQPSDPFKESEDGSPLGNDQNIAMDYSVGNVEFSNDFPSPEPNPFKLPKVVSPATIAFSTTHLLSNKPKRQRLAHSISYDPSYKTIDLCKNPYLKKFSIAMARCPEFVPEKDRWEKTISGYLDTSTPTGATITAINFGLKRVTETDKYLMITKSSSSCPNEFLEDGISHIEATSAVYQSLMKHSTCYDLMPDSGKVVIIDSQIQIGRAFEAIEDNIVRASPIWSSEKQDFIALLTVNDLVPLLLHMYENQTGKDHCYDDEEHLKDFSSITVEICLNAIPKFRALQNHIIGVTPETNLHSVNVIYNQFHKTVVLVIDSFLSGNPLFLLTGLRTLTYIFYKVYTVSLESCFITKISSSKLLEDHHFEILKPLSERESPCQTLCMSSPGKNQYLIYSCSSIVDVLRAMAKSYYCCALIISNQTINDDKSMEFVIREVITMTDILNLVKMGKHRDTTLTAAQILRYRGNYNMSTTYRDPVINCCIDDSIDHLINIIVKEKASFVLVRSKIDEDSTTMGILTAHDVLSYIDSLPSGSLSIHNSIQPNRSTEKLLPYSEPPLNKFAPTIFHDSLEEMFDMEFS